MRLVHQQNGVAQFLAVQVAQGRARLEDIIIIGHDGVRPPRQFQLRLKRADLFPFGLGKTVSGSKCQWPSRKRSRIFDRSIFSG